MDVSQIIQEFSTTQALILLCLALLYAYYRYATSYHGVWQRIGIPGPKPWPVLDHWPDLRQGLDVVMDKWFQQYGKTFGAYGIIPHRATLITKDLSLIRHVLVKDFNNFHTRMRSIPDNSTLIRHAVTAVGGDRWSRQRRATNPMFSGVKLRMMLQHVNRSVDSLMSQVNQHVVNGQLIPVKDLADRFASEVMARTELGLTTQGETKETSEFQFHTQNLANIGSRAQRFALALVHYIPHSFSLMRALNSKVSAVNTLSESYFKSLFKTFMRIRGKEDQSPESKVKKTTDMLGFMMEVQVDEKDPCLTQKESKALTETEVLANGLILILAGVETMSTTFRSILYCLAQHQDVQDKVLAEIEDVIPDSGEFQYEYLPELKYMEQVINECLRLFPLVTTTHRIAVETKTYEGITIPKDSVVQIPFNKIMVDPEHWPEPNKFDPDRFSPQNREGRDPLAFMPFGYGPRVCLGQRLAMMELKVVLSVLLRKISLKLSERTTPKKGEILKLQKQVGIINRHVDKVEIEAMFRT